MIVTEFQFWITYFICSKY